MFTTFRLRSLLIAISVVSLLLAREARRARIQQSISAEVAVVGGRVSRDSRKLWSLAIDNSPVGRWLCRLVDPAYLQVIKRIELRTQRCTTRTLQLVAGASDLESLTLDTSAISDDGMQCLSGLTRLSYLLVNSRQISDEGISVLSHLRGLRTLIIKDVCATDESVEVFCALPNLRYFVPPATLSQDAVVRLRACLPNTDIDVVVIQPDRSHAKAEWELVKQIGCASGATNGCVVRWELFTLPMHSSGGQRHPEWQAHRVILGCDGQAQVDFLHHRSFGSFIGQWTISNDTLRIVSDAEQECHMEFIGYRDVGMNYVFRSALNGVDTFTILCVE